MDAGKYETWLIDYYQTGLNHQLTDFTKLESVIKFELLDNQNLKSLLDAEQILIRPELLSDPIDYQKGTFPLEIEKMIDSVKTIRTIASQYSQPLLTQAIPYYISLFYQYANALTFKSNDEHKKRLILLFLCVLGERLKKAP